jgi:hypothetical protein
MSADLQQVAPRPALHTVAVICGKLLLAGLGIAIGLFAGFVLAALTGLIRISC